ncbi:hypothetical protein DFA_00587 [Cavenderia fasciculata]|uniref:Uncharacterized protein n=1 Tax=Cavenderia fasciculata TaxID=261658 RepID=F4PSN2_CACFS|nr:uncharacterized protein DFA_00587 [Cavenderia fasciculata]EGG20724.1 hypothetical protein DFA_00587 [Cavenderia fasciculata]|eukprot:XP_004358574.1 hypothetical protein DFA_00587 [Cavenderia fasciculata]
MSVCKKDKIVPANPQNPQNISLCDSNKECQSWLDCTDGVCKESDYADVGEACTFDYQCTNDLVCSNGICKASLTTCQSPSDCSFSNYCSSTSKVCIPRLNNGDLCTDDESCPAHSLCNIKCIAKFSLEHGALCNDDLLCDISQGLECDNGACAYTNLTKTLTPSSRNCSNSNTDCYNGQETCICSTGVDEYTGFCFATSPLTKSQILSCGSSKKNFYDCLTDKSCLYYYNQDVPKSCQLQKCGALFCDCKRQCSWEYDTDSQGKNCGGQSVSSHQGTCQYLGYSISSSLSSNSLISMRQKKNDNDNTNGVSVIFVISFFLIYHSVDGEGCESTSQRICSRNGETCNSVYGESSFKCVDGSFCNKLKICEAQKKEGESCDKYQDRQCLDWLSCVNGTCIEEHYAALGESCKTSEQCYRGTCFNGKCLKPNCNVNDDCDYFSYCSYKNDEDICRPRLEDGTTCNQKHDICMPHSICGFDSKCIPKYSLGLNRNCTDQEECDVSQGLRCSSLDGACVYRNLTFTPTSPSFNCSASHCDNQEEDCVCSERGDTGHCLPRYEFTKAQILSCGSQTKSLTVVVNFVAIIESANGNTIEIILAPTVPTRPLIITKVYANILAILFKVHPPLSLFHQYSLQSSFYHPCFFKKVKIYSLKIEKNHSVYVDSDHNQKIYLCGTYRMNHRILLYICLTIIFLSTSTTCVYSQLTQCTSSNQKCIEVGQSCSLCQPAITSGGSCSTTNECQGWLECLGGICVEADYGQFQDNCTEDYQCTGNLACMHGKCGNPNPTCTSDYQCQYSDYCVNGTCISRIKDGESCVTDNSCLEQSTCNFKTCIPRYSVALNQPCYHLSYSCDVSKGLVCSNSVCVLSNLTKTLTPSNINCSSTQCFNSLDNYEQCVCKEGTTNTGECYPRYPTTKHQILLCGSRQKALYKCLADNQCYFGTADTISSCQMKYCSKEYCESKSTCLWGYDVGRVDPGCGGNTAFDSLQQTCQYLGYSVIPNDLSSSDSSSLDSSDSSTSTPSHSHIISISLIPTFIFTILLVVVSIFQK